MLAAHWREKRPVRALVSAAPWRVKKVPIRALVSAARWRGKERTQEGISVSCTLEGERKGLLGH